MNGAVYTLYVCIEFLNNLYKFKYASFDYRKHIGILRYLSCDNFLSTR